MIDPCVAPENMLVGGTFLAREDNRIVCSDRESGENATVRRGMKGGVREG